MRDSRPNRRRFLALGAGLFTVSLVPVFRGRRATLHRRTIPVMGTIAEVAVVHADARAAQAAIDAALGELERVDETMSRFRSRSDIGRLNAGGRGGPVAIGDATAHVLRESIRWAEGSGGEFDPCLLRAIEAWNVGARTAPPPESGFRRLAGRRLHRALGVDRWRGGDVAILAEEDAAVDLGGIGKGYAVDRAVQALRERGIERAFVNAGGDLYAMGESEDGDAWRVGVQSPEDPSRIDRTLELSDAAVATSGDYLRFFLHGGRRYHHLLDPGTAAPRRTGRHSLTVRAARCIDADAAATALYGTDPGALPALRLPARVEIVATA
jgi:thiamine biosynthesis lipoprotein